MCLFTAGDAVETHASPSLPDDGDGADCCDESSMNEEQRAVFDAVMAAIECRDIVEPRVFFLSAPAGCGKTYVYKCLINRMIRMQRKFKASALTAIAAGLLPEGETCHTTYGIPVRSRLSGNERSYIERGTPAGDALAETSLLVIDEASMLSKIQMSIIDNLLRVSCENATICRYHHL